jgi:hypothetical protein
MTDKEKITRLRLTLEVVLNTVQQAARGQPQDWIDIGRSIRGALSDAREPEDENQQNYGSDGSGGW